MARQEPGSSSRQPSGQEPRSPAARQDGQEPWLRFGPGARQQQPAGWPDLAAGRSPDPAAARPGARPGARQQQQPGQEPWQPRSARFEPVLMAARQQPGQAAGSSPGHYVRNHKKTAKTAARQPAGWPDQEPWLRIGPGARRARQPIGPGQAAGLLAAIDSVNQ